MGREGGVGGIEPRLDRGIEAHDPLRLGQALLVPGQQGHGLDQRLDDEEVVLVLRVGELEAVAEFGDPVLDLDAGVDLHEEVAVAVDDAFEGRGGIETDGLAEALRFLFHPFENLQVALQRLDFGLLAGGLGLVDGSQPALPG